MVIEVDRRRFMATINLLCLTPAQLKETNLTEEAVLHMAKAAGDQLRGFERVDNMADYLGPSMLYWLPDE
jgi:hypothetical protein